MLGVLAVLNALCLVGATGLWVRARTRAVGPERAACFAAVLDWARHRDPDGRGAGGEGGHENGAGGGSALPARTRREVESLGRIDQHGGGRHVRPERIGDPARG